MLSKLIATKGWTPSARRRLRLGAVAAALILGVTCSSGDKPPSLGSSPSDEAARIDQARATQLVVRLEDLPAGWTAAPHRAGEDDDRVERELRSCLEAGPRPARTADAKSDDFRQAQAQVTSRVTSTKTLEEARQEFTMATSPQFRPCLLQVYRRSFGRDSGQQIGLEAVKVEPLPVQTLADGSVGNRLTITVPAATGARTYFADTFFVLSGRAQVSVNFLSLGSPVDAQLERLTLSRVAERAKA